MDQTKKQLRIKYKQLRSKLTLEEVQEKSLAIANNLLKLNIWNKTFYHLFLSIEEQNEVNTEFILHILQGKDKEIVVSKSDFKTLEMTNYLLTDATKFKKNKYNILEPVNGIEVPNTRIEVVFIPLLAFDKKGNRVGYGKGFYDNFLSKCNSETIKVGLSFFEPENLIYEIYENDVKLDYCVTATTIFNYQF